MRLSLVCLCVRVWLLWFLHVQPQPPAISTAQTFTPSGLFQIPSVGRTNVIWNPEQNSAAARPHNSRPTCSLARSPDWGQGVRRGRVAACRSNGAQGPKRRQSCRPHCCMISSQARYRGPVQVTNYTIHSSSSEDATHSVMDTDGTLRTAE